MERIKKGLELRQTDILPVSTTISDRARQLIDAYALSHNLQMGDALIAATALEHGLVVLTANTKHFCSIEGLKVEAFVP